MEKTLYLRRINPEPSAVTPLNCPNLRDIMASDCSA